MMIVNADDWGRSKAETNAALECYREGRITSATAMVFMEDSARGAELANECGIAVGLHFNLSQPYDGGCSSPAAAAAHNRLVRFMRSSRFAVLLYHPGLHQAFRDVFRSQTDEFERLFKRKPSHVDGHQHRHLCANVIFGDVIPSGTRVRRNFSFFPGDKGWINRTYRRLVDCRLAKRYRLTDYFFSLPHCVAKNRLGEITNLARNSKVELMTHPVKTDEYSLLMSETFSGFLQGSEMASYASV